MGGGGHILGGGGWLWVMVSIFWEVVGGFNLDSGGSKGIVLGGGFILSSGGWCLDYFR